MGDATQQYSGIIPLQYGVYVYRCWTADDICIYVGRTRHVLRRMGAHALVSWWKDVHHVDIAVMPDVAAASAEEIAQIRALRPINNSHYNRTWARQSTKPSPTHCPQQHEFTDANTLYNGKGSKICRECKNAKARAKPKKGLARGERQGSAALTNAAVADIRRQRALGRTLKDLAKVYGVDHSTIRRAAEGITWKHIKTEDAA